MKNVKDWVTQVKRLVKTFSFFTWLADFWSFLQYQLFGTWIDLFPDQAHWSLSDAFQCHPARGPLSVGRGSQDLGKATDSDLGHALSFKYQGVI